MPLVWNLRKWLAVNRDIYRPVDLQKLIAEKTGVHLTLQAVSALMKGKPSAVRISTLEALCAALDCPSSEFFMVLPPSAFDEPEVRAVGDTLAPQHEAKESKRSQESPFPDPYQYKGIEHSTSPSKSAHKSKNGQQKKS